MRVSVNSYTNAMLDQFNQLSGLQYSLQSQASTGLRVQSASDDPAAMADTLNLAANKSADTQWSSNITTLQSRANQVYTVLQSLQTKVSRAGEIATAAANSTTSPDSLNSYADEVNTMIEDTVKLGNTQDSVTGSYLFGGTASGSSPFTVTRDANNNITGVTYNGNTTTNQTEIGNGLTIAVDVPGANTTGSGSRGLFTDSQSGADFLNHLIQLRDDLKAGNTTAITADNTNLKSDENNTAYQVANNGVVQNRLTAASTYLSTDSANVDKAVSNASSADLAETIVALTKAQNGYSAALQSSVKIMQLSIFNYIS